MRKSTAIVATLVAASSLAVSLRLGELETIQDISADTSSQEPIEIVPTPSQTPTASAEANPSPSPSETTSSNPTKPALKPITKNSDVIDYKYGVLQLSVTVLGNEITDVGVIQGETSNGRAEAYAILSEATVQIQGTNYGNVSGATYTTEAFKIAIENALGKF